MITHHFTGLMEVRMENQIQLCSLFSLKVFFLSAFEVSTSPKYTASDIGYEIDPQDMADELAALLPVNQTPTTPLEAAPEDFEEDYGWFIS
jgi:hypothetical protein